MRLKTIKIANEIGTILGMRFSSENFWKKLETEYTPKDKITIDFINVDFMGRAFAQDYIYRRYYTELNVKEVNIPNNIVRGMFAVVEGDLPEYNDLIVNREQFFKDLHDGKVEDY